MQLRNILVVAVLALGTQSLAQADTLVIDAARAGATAGIDKPGRGQTMASVENRYGAPQQIVPAVGEPPITRWIYDGFTVYFEGNVVLHTVVNR